MSHILQCSIIHTTVEIDKATRQSLAGYLIVRSTCSIDAPRQPFSTSMILNGNKRRIGALSSRQGGLFAPSKSGGSSSSSYLCRLLQSRTPSGTRRTTTPENSNGSGILASTWDRRPRPRRDVDIDRRQAAYGCCCRSQRAQKRPRKPTDAYQYFFREQCLELSKMENGAGDTFDMSSSASKSNKRRKSPTGEAIHLKINIGKTVAKQWRELTPAQRQKYEDLAEKDAERYRTEVEEYYLEPNGVHGRGAGVGGLSAGTGRLAAIMAAPSASRAPNKLLLMGSNSGSNNNGNSLALIAVNSALSTSTITNKTSLQSLLHERRTQLLDDLSSLNQITSSRLSAGRSALAGPVDPAVRQRLYYLSVGPGTGGIGPSPWGSAIRSSNASSASSTFTAGIGGIPAISSPKTSSTPAMKAAADGPSIEILES